MMGSCQACENEHLQVKQIRRSHIRSDIRLIPFILCWVWHDFFFQFGAWLWTDSVTYWSSEFMRQTCFVSRVNLLEEEGLVNWVSAMALALQHAVIFYSSSIAASSDSRDILLIHGMSSWNPTRQIWPAFVSSFVNCHFESILVEWSILECGRSETMSLWKSTMSWKDTWQQIRVSENHQNINDCLIFRVIISYVFRSVSPHSSNLIGILEHLRVKCRQKFLQNEPRFLALIPFSVSAATNCN
jgi:hypothetical protein